VPSRISRAKTEGSRAACRSSSFQARRLKAAGFSSLPLREGDISSISRERGDGRKYGTADVAMRGLLPARIRAMINPARRLLVAKSASRLRSEALNLNESSPGCQLGVVHFSRERSTWGARPAKSRESLPLFSVTSTRRARSEGIARDSA